MAFKQITSIEDLENLALELGFLPFFSCGISGYSVEELIRSDMWFSSEQEGPWKWKGPIIQNNRLAYGKFFRHKAVFVSLEWLPDFINYRRSLRPKISDDLAALDDIVLQSVEIDGSATIKKLRQELDYACGRKKRSDYDLVDTLPLTNNKKISLDPILSRLQMETRLVIKDFEYNTDRHGKPYGWGIARYATPETLYGREITNAEGRAPEESRQRIFDHLSKIIPNANEKQITKLIG